MSLLNVGARALLTNQIALQTTGNNIANVSTTGYSRQSAHLVTVPGQYSPQGYIGKGVAVETILRNHNELITRQAAIAGSAQAGDKVRSERLNQLQEIYTGGKDALGTAISDMLGSLSDVLNSPTDMTARTVTLTRMGETAGRFRTAAERLSDIEYTVNEQLKNNVSKINSLARSVAAVNGEIAAAKGNGQSPNDLLDKRDQLIREINQYIQTSQIPADDGTVGVFVAGSQPLVMATTATELSLQVAKEFPGSGQMALYIQRQGTQVELNEQMLGGGEMQGLLRFANQDMAEGRNLLGRLAQGMAMTMNEQHKLGRTLDGEFGKDLFAVPTSVPGYSSSATAAGNVSFTDPTKFAASDYEVRFAAGGDVQILRLSDNKTTTFSSPITYPANLEVDGLSFNLTTAGSVGDRMLFKPFASTAQAIEAKIYAPKDLAAANPINAAMGTANAGSLQLVSLKATGLIYKDAAAASAATPPGAIKPENPAVNWNLTLKFDGAGGYSVFQPGSATPFATGTYTPGQPISVPNGDWQITVQGTPKNGDTITLGHSLDTALYGDAYTRNAGNASALMNLRDAPMFDNATLQDGWANAMSNVGTRTQSAQYAANMSTSIADSLESQRVAVSGVNLDEEAAKLIQYQQAYQASAKMLQIAQSIFDSLLQTVSR